MSILQIKKKTRLERSRVSGLRCARIWRLHLLRSWVGKKDSRQNLWILDCIGWCCISFDSQSMQEYFSIRSNFKEWMDTLQMNPKAICEDVAFHHPREHAAFYRMHNVKIIPTRPHTPWPNRAEMGARLFKKFLLALVDTASQNTTLAQITLVQWMRKAATVINIQITSSGKTSMELAMGRRPRDLLGSASMNPEQLTTRPTKQDLLNEEIQKRVMRTHLEVQQREDIRRSC